MSSVASRDRKRLSGLAAIAALIGVTGSATLASSAPTSVVQIVIGIALVALFMAVDTEARVIPRVLRPAPVFFASLTVASVSASALTADEYDQYFLLWSLQAGGAVAGFLLAPRLARVMKDTRGAVDVSRYVKFSTALFLLTAIAALMYFVTQGVPALQSDLEQARVDAAQGGSGYIRLLAFLLPTATAALVAARGNKAWPHVVLALVVMLGFGNRVPFIYFLFPLAAMIAVTTRRLGSAKIVSIAALLFILMGSLAAWRVFNTADMAGSYQYRDAVARGDGLAVAGSALAHYSRVVPENAVMVKRFVDEGDLGWQYGSTYVTLFTSALPGKQTSPDMLLKELNGVDFIGGGIPPTLAGEGYMNFGYAGVFLNAMTAMLLIRYWASVVVSQSNAGRRADTRISGLVYGYALTWVCLAQISGFAGSATISLAGFLVLVGLRWSTRAAANPQFDGSLN